MGLGLFLWGLGCFWGVKVLLWGRGAFGGLVSFCGVGVRQVVGNGRIFQPEPATQ